MPARPAYVLIALKTSPNNLLSYVIQMEAPAIHQCDLWHVPVISSPYIQFILAQWLVHSRCLIMFMEEVNMNARENPGPKYMI